MTKVHDADAEREHQAGAECSGEQGAGDGVEPQAVAEEARGQHQQRCREGDGDDDAGHGPAPHPAAARRTSPVVDGEVPAVRPRLGQLQPTSSRPTRSTSAIFSPPSLTSHLDPTAALGLPNVVRCRALLERGMVAAPEDYGAPT